MRSAMSHMQLSARAFHRVLKLARAAPTSTGQTPSSPPF
jgi:hypothetical protein